MASNDIVELAELVERLRSTIAEEVTNLTLTVEQQGRNVTELARVLVGELVEIVAPAEDWRAVWAGQIFATLLTSVAREVIVQPDGPLVEETTRLIARRTWQLVEALHAEAPRDRLKVPDVGKGAGDEPSH